MLENSENDIAIIGIAGKFPKACSINEYWENLKGGVCSIVPSDTNAILDSGIPPDFLNHSNFINAASKLENAKLFDAEFFGLSNTEASLMDPQIRLLLENSWHALEDAGYGKQNFDIPIGNYCGMSTNSYLIEILKTKELKESVDPLLYRILNEKDFLASWISYKLNFSGPAMTVQSACSTSLLAVHLACQSLLNRECDMAMAGGVSYDASGHKGYMYVPGSIYSKVGICRPFDKNADGTVVGNGVGSIVLKRAEDAINDRDHIYAIIKGTAVNNDGANKQSYTAPSVDYQRNVILEALALSDVNPNTLGMIEAHGTGTRIGDPIEVTALKEAFREYTNRNQFCALGSVKGNIGHLDAAAGIASLIKATFCVNKGVIVPNVNYTDPNPELKLNDSPFYVNQSCNFWPDNFEKRRAGISSLGVGGTNVHVIIEEPPVLPKTEKNTNLYNIGLSAETKESLEKQKIQLLNFIKSEPDIEMRDIEFTSLHGRKMMFYRFSTLSRSKDELLSQLSGKHTNGCYVGSGNISSNIFLFPGQGSQYPKMAFKLYENHSPFKDDMDNCFRILGQYSTIDFKKILFNDDQAVLNHTPNTQVLLFIVEYCLAQELLRIGIKPEAMIGHSLGEYVAACISECISLEDALKLVYHRGRLMGFMPDGGMILVKGSEKEIRPLLLETISISAYNSTDNLILGGESRDIDIQIQILESKGIFFKKLNVSHAYHTSAMSGVLKDFNAILSQVNFKKPKVRVFSTFTGQEVSSEEFCSNQYWLDQIIKPVQFSEAIKNIVQSISNPVFIEVGPGNGLSSFIKADKKDEIKTVSLLPSFALRDSTIEFFHKSKAMLHSMGVIFEQPKNYNGKRISLPGYCFSHKYYWKPQLPISYDNIEGIKASHHFKDNRYKKNRLRMTVEVDLKKIENISDEIFSNINQIQKEYKNKIENLFSKSDKLISENIEMLYDTHLTLSDPENIASNEDKIIRRSNQLYVEPETDTEKTIAILWGEILGYEKVGILDNYFDVGGNSLLAIQLINRISNELNIELIASEVMTNQTVKEISSLVEEKIWLLSDEESENELII